MSAYLLIFSVSLLAATILPFSSEALLATQLSAGTHHVTALIAAAATGNVLGSAINWVLGRYSRLLVDAAWFPFSKKDVERAGRHFRKFGLWSLLFAWLPIVGDPLTFVAGTLGVGFWPFILLVAIGKTARYAAIGWAI